MMLVSVFGTSTPFGYWGFTTVRHLMQVIYGDHHHIHCLGIEDLRQSWAVHGDKPVVFTSDCPDHEISDLFIEFGAPIIVFLDEPEKAIAFAKVSRQLSAREAIRFSTQCFCSLYDILIAPQAICFSSQHLNDDLREILAKLLQILVGSADIAQIEEVMRRTIFDYKPGQFVTVADQVVGYCVNGPLPQEALDIQTPETQNLISAATRAYGPIFKRKPLLQLEWHRELFFTSNEGNANPELINLTGPARRLIWGPYLYLPKGEWIVKVEFEVAENFSGNMLEADVFDGQDLLAVAMADLPIEGKFCFELPFIIHNLQRPIEIRLGLLKGAIEGKFSLNSIFIRRASAAVEYFMLQNSQTMRPKPSSAFEVSFVSNIN